LDGRHVVFGCVLEGFDIVRLIEMNGTGSGRPKRKVTITKCGLLKDDDNREEKKAEKDAPQK
jgi:cyclophilin family peptidyl-prolyl cis-trans isomerase